MVDLLHKQNQSIQFAAKPYDFDLNGLSVGGGAGVDLMYLYNKNQ